MINKETAKVQYTTVADQSTWYAVDFEYFTTPATGLPQLKVLLDGQELTAGKDYVTGPQGIQLVVAPTAGVSLVIERDVPFTQEIDFQMGLIDPEKIERGLDESVMRDQELATGISDLAAKHDSLAEEVEEVRTVAESAAADAASAVQTSTDAANAADSASKTATEAKTVATEAKTAADNADSKAQEALDLANSYDARITTAQNTADSAKTTADQALAGLDEKQDKGDYATKAELTQGLAGKADTSVTDTLRNDVDGLDGQVSGIEEKIPSDASSSNQLATKDDLSNIDALPSQAGNEGKFLTTDGKDASWAEIKQGGGIDYKWKKFEANNANQQEVIALDIDLGVLSDGKYTFFVRSPYDEDGGEAAHRIVMEVKEGELLKGYFSPEPTLSAEPCSFPDWVVNTSGYFSYAYKNPVTGHFGYAAYAAYLSIVPAVGYFPGKKVSSASFYVSGVFINDSTEASDIVPAISVRENPSEAPIGSFELGYGSSYIYTPTISYQSVGFGDFTMGLHNKYIVCSANGLITNGNYQEIFTNYNVFPKTLSVSGFIVNNTTDSFDLVIRATRTDGFVVLRKKVTGAFPGIKSIKQGFDSNDPYTPRIAIELDGTIEGSPTVYLSACWDGTNHQNVNFTTVDSLDIWPVIQWTDAKDESTSGGSGAVSSVNGKTGDVVLSAEDVGAVDKNQGSENAGKFLKVGADGQVVASAESGGGGLAAVAHDATLEGDGTDGNPLTLSASISRPQQFSNLFVGQLNTGDGIMSYGPTGTSFGNMLNFTATAGTNPIVGFYMRGTEDDEVLPAGQVLTTFANVEAETGKKYNTLDVCAMNNLGRAAGFVARIDYDDTEGTVELYAPKDLPASDNSNLVPTTKWVQKVASTKQNTLSAEQLAAVNSGITADRVASYDAYASEISTAQSTADKADNAAEVAQQTANLAGQEAAQALSGLAGKVNINQGADNVGKVMTVGADGNLAPADMPETSLPDQTGNAGKFLTTDGTNASWGEVQAAAVTTDATLTGTGTPDNPLGVAQSVKDSIDGKVSKSGDTMTGALNFNLQANAEIIRFTPQSWLETTAVAQQITWCFGSNDGWAIGYNRIRSEKDNFGVIGDSDYRLKNVYTYLLNNGADIAIPTTGGTMALLSDIPDVSEFQTASQVTTIADTQANAAINSRFLVVDELPAEPDANTFYFIKKA